MSVFTKSLRIGLDKAELTIENIKDIENVFYELNCEVKKETGGKLEIIKTEVTDGFATMAARIMSSNANEKQQKGLIEGFNPLAKSRKSKLARWSISASGYPFTLFYGTNEIYCEDAISLSRALADLLEDASIGRILFNLINNPESEIDDVPF